MIKDQSSYDLIKHYNESQERGALGMTVKFGESIELSNGVSVIIKKMKGIRVSVVVVVPKNVVVYRPTECVGDERKGLSNG